MVRSLPHPSAFAEIDAKRIAGNTVVVLVHALAFAVLMAPSTWEPPVPAPRLEVVVPVVAEPRLPPPIPPPPVDPIRLPRETRTPTPIPTPRVDNTPVTDTAPVLDTGTELAEPSDDAGPVVDTFDPGPPQVETLAYDVSPAPRYPRQALRSSAEGTVVLKVLVDEQGRPQEVMVERSSGHRLLDQAARDQVLAKWRFHPATRGGRAVAAYALVPIAFNLP
jgi:protein TonB